jgi:hypothetical protein
VTVMQVRLIVDFQQLWRKSCRQGGFHALGAACQFLWH